MTRETKEILEWFFNLIGCFNHYSFFTKKLWRKVKGFEEKDEAEIKCMFMHYWLHNKFGYYTCPCGMSWFLELDAGSYNNYIKEHKPVIDAFEKWIKEQR